MTADVTKPWVNTPSTSAKNRPWAMRAESQESSRKYGCKPRGSTGETTAAGLRISGGTDKYP